jgi:hypothetical protein
MPLRDSGYAVGLIARANPKGALTRLLAEKGTGRRPLSNLPLRQREVMRLHSTLNRSTCSSPILYRVSSRFVRVDGDRLYANYFHENRCTNS